MKAYLSLGRWLFAVPFAIFGLLHFMDTAGMSNMVPLYMPVKEIWVYVTGACLIAAALSMLIGLYDKLAATLLSMFMLIIVVLMHVPGAMNSAPNMMPDISLAMLLKDMGLAGAAMMYAEHYAKDNRGIKA